MICKVCQFWYQDIGQTYVGCGLGLKLVIARYYDEGILVEKETGTELACRLFKAIKEGNDAEKR